MENNNSTSVFPLFGVFDTTDLDAIGLFYEELLASFSDEFKKLIISNPDNESV